MRFTENGPAIPDELLVARDEGNVLFFCGAGVSLAFAGLSDFLNLAGDVIEDLGSLSGSKSPRSPNGRSSKASSSPDHTSGQAPSFQKPSGSSARQI